MPEDLVDVLSGATDDGFAWTLRAGGRNARELMTMLRVARDGQWGEGGFGGPALVPGDPINTWIGGRDRQPTFMIIRAAPRVDDVEIINCDGRSWALSLSPTDERFGLRFGVFRVPDGAEVVEVRVSQSEGPGQAIRSPHRSGG